MLVETEPQRWGIIGEDTADPRQQIQKLVDKGLRAQLKTGSLLTGQLFVDIDFHPDAPKAQVKFEQQFSGNTDHTGTFADHHRQGQ